MLNNVCLCWLYKCNFNFCYLNVINVLVSFYSWCRRKEWQFLCRCMMCYSGWVFKSSWEAGENTLLALRHESKMLLILFLQGNHKKHILNINRGDNLMSLFLYSSYQLSNIWDCCSDRPWIWVNISVVHCQYPIAILACRLLFWVDPG